MRCGLWRDKEISFPAERDFVVSSLPFSPSRRAFPLLSPERQPPLWSRLQGLSSKYHNPALQRKDSPRISRACCGARSHHTRRATLRWLPA